MTARSHVLLGMGKTGRKDVEALEQLRPGVLTSPSAAGEQGKLLWKDNWVTFMDTMLQVSILGSSQQSLQLPTRVTAIYIDPATHRQKVYRLKEDTQGSSGPSSMPLHPGLGIAYTNQRVSIAADVTTSRCLGITVSGGIHISRLQTTATSRRQQEQLVPTLEKFVFTPHMEAECLSESTALQKELQLCKGEGPKPSPLLLHSLPLKLARQGLDSGELGVDESSLPSMGLQHKTTASFLFPSRGCFCCGQARKWALEVGGRP